MVEVDNNMHYGGFNVPECQRIILIDITNACLRRCTNCLRLCNHRTAEWFVDIDWFQDVLCALTDFSGVIGVFGGEPLLHPHFSSIMQIIRSAFGEQIRAHGVVDVDELGKLKNGIGLWTTADEKLWENHADDIRRTFTFVRINDHLGVIRHFPILVCPDELGYSDTELNNLPPCWISQCCASSVTPWGAYFCEVAGALDGFLKFGLGHVPCAGWWNDAFVDQRVLCGFCGARVPLRWTSDRSVNVVSPMWYHWLTAAGSKEKFEIITQKPDANASRKRQLVVQYSNDIHCQRELLW